MQIDLSTVFAGVAALGTIASIVISMRDRRFALIDKRFDLVDKRFESVDKRFDEVKEEIRLAEKRSIERDIDLKNAILELKSEMHQEFAKLNARFDDIEQDTIDMDKRLIVLETLDKASQRTQPAQTVQIKPIQRRRRRNSNGQLQ